MGLSEIVIFPEKFGGIKEIPRIGEGLMYPWRPPTRNYLVHILHWKFTKCYFKEASGDIQD